MIRATKFHIALPRPPAALAICAIVFSRRRGGITSVLRRFDDEESASLCCDSNQYNLYVANATDIISHSLLSRPSSSHSSSRVPKKIKSIIGEDIVLDITEEDVRRVFNFLKVAEYLKTKKSFQVWISVGFLGWNMKDNKEREVDEEIYVGTTTKVIYTPADISALIDDLVTNFNKTRESSYIKLFNLFKIDIHVAKVKALTASSYIELPDRIANKKAVINIKNEDNLCFVYSVLCGLKTPEKDAQRVNKYKDRLHELQYKPEDMPMDINKIIHCEKRNELRINVYGLEGKTYEIIPLCVSSN